MRNCRLSYEAVEVRPKREHLALVPDVGSGISSFRRWAMIHKLDSLSVIDRILTLDAEKRCLLIGHICVCLILGSWHD